MIELTREVRFQLGTVATAANSWSGFNSAMQIQPFVRLQCSVMSELEPETGYVCNIKLIDHLVRDQLVPTLNQQLSSQPGWFKLLYSSVDAFQTGLPTRLTLRQIALWVSPFVCLTWRAQDKNVITYTEQFEFSASHRLHNADLTDQQNQQLFGKCNHPNGHGHNYLLDVSVQVDAESTLDVAELQQTVQDRVISRLDHKHLNLDVEQFKSLNPTVENIATTIAQWLRGEIGGARVSAVRVYETTKTWAQVDLETK